MKTRCPRCNQGWVSDFRIKATGATVFVCEECEALWLDGQKISFEKFEDMSTSLENQGLAGTWNDLEMLDHDSPNRK